MLELIDISYSAPSDSGEKEILKNINIKLDKGFIAITGPNGGGKSSLAKIICGLYKPTSGKILLNGVDITNYGVTERARAGISFGFQQPVRFKGITVKDLITIASGKKTTISDACEYLSEVGLCARDYIDREINSSLSGGELKRIEIATVLARNSSFSVFDEPEAGIDLWSFNSLITVFNNLRKKNDGTILIISHQERILSIADRVIMLNGGEVTEDGNADKVLCGILKQNTCSKLLEGE
ncbi:MAG: ATP-binding cassette domain-containing protein [Clostridia bacterium]|nr:ATP-binding cassette domain-containing protein [Clostridia bacterium]